jgi:hypothetical protein
MITQVGGSGDAAIGSSELPQLSDASGSASVGEAGLEVSGSGEADNGGNLVTVHEPTT